MHLSHANAKLIDDWLASPPDRRVFVIGSRDDEAHVERLRQRYPELVFGFYQDCKPLCRESTIDALFGSSKTVISIESPHAETSLFIPVEIGMAKAHLGLGKQLMLIDPDEARRLLNSSGSLSLTSTLVSCSLDAILRDEAACL